METKTVKDLMLPLEEYAVVHEDATLREAMMALDQAQNRVHAGRQPHRAVLVADETGRIVGKIGHLGFLKALEPKYSVLGDVEKLAGAGVTPMLVDLMMSNYRFWQDDQSVLRARANTIKVGDVMHSVEESVDENQPLTEALHRIIMWQSLSILVRRDDRVVGILRLSDLFTEFANIVKSV